VTFKKLSVHQITAYFQKVDPLDKAGAYAIQTNPEMIIENREGSLLNVIGLPLEKLGKELKLLEADN
jgi:septum formation protein